MKLKFLYSAHLQRAYQISALTSQPEQCHVICIKAWLVASFFFFHLLHNHKFSCKGYETK